MSYTSRNIYCEGYTPKKATFIDKVDLKLSISDTYNNIRLILGELGKSIENNDDLAFDLIRISTYIYIADCRTQRGTLKNAYDEHWNVELNFFIPVLKPRFWNKKEVKDLLKKMFNFAVGHSFNFTFVKWDGKDKQLFLKLFSKKHKPLDIDCVSMFSGGLDSLYSSLLLLEDKRKPLLLSHCSTGKLVKFRTDLHQSLEKEYNQKIARWEVPINNKQTEAQEFTQRSRSVVYACLGSAFAKCLNVNDVYLSDNGIVTFNLRSTAQNIGTLNTRSTNPKLLDYVNQLNKIVWKNNAPQVENKLIWLTKAEVIKGIKDLGKDYLLSMSTSCVSTKNLSLAHPYCGICSQCVDRRFAVEWAKISNDSEPREHYRVNIFTDDLINQNDKGIGKTHAENYYRKAEILHSISDFDFLDKFNEIYDFIPDNVDETDFLKNVFDLHKRYAKQVVETIQSYWTDYKQGNYPENSLVSMAFRESSSPTTINDYSIKEKEIIINEHKKSFVFRGVAIDNLTKFEFEFLLALLSEPDRIIPYDELMKASIGDLKGYSMPAQTHKRNINKKIIEKCNNNGLNLQPKFSFIQTLSGVGYRIKSEFQNEILIEKS